MTGDGGPIFNAVHAFATTSKFFALGEYYVIVFGFN